MVLTYVFQMVLTYIFQMVLTYISNGTDLYFK